MQWNHPLILNNIRGNTINLTASEMAWSLRKQKSIVNENNGIKFIDIPPHDTALIETAETIHVSKKIGGTYHSRVSKVSLGLGHIGTTLDPGWIGPSLIALHNHLDVTVTIEVGDSIASIIFHYLNTESTYENTNGPGQIDVLYEKGINITSQELNYLGEEWHKNVEKLREKMINSKEFEKLKAARNKTEEAIKYSARFQFKAVFWSYIVPTLSFVIAVIYLTKSVIPTMKQSNIPIFTTLVAFAGVIVLKIGDIIHRRFER